MLKILILAGSLLLGAATPFTERTKTDFDTFLQLLNPYGKWAKIENVWLYEPFSPYIPMTEGRWIYTDFGWYWQGQRAFSWATDHYGTWVLGQDNVWRWKPDGNWQPAKVEWRGTNTMVGWRPTVINRFGEKTESESVRYARPEEWIFLSREKLTKTFMGNDVTAGAAAKPLLEQSEAVNHTYVSWREIDRDGPDPYDIYGVAKSFLAQQTPAPKQAMNLGGSGGEDLSPIIVAAPTAADNAPAGTNDKDKDKKPPIYTVMSLPSFYYVAQPNPLKLEIYVYRPELYQDGEGIQRRIDVWHNPPARQANREKVSRVLEHGTMVIEATPTNSAPTAPATTATSSTPATATASSSTPVKTDTTTSTSSSPTTKSSPYRSK